MRRRYVAALIGGLAFLGLAIAVVAVGLSTRTDGYETVQPVASADGTVTYVIPEGTRQRIAAGEDIAVIPAKLTMKVGQRLVLRNEDDGAHIAGPFFVGPGETSTYVFSEPKVISGDCTIHPSGHFEVEVIAE